MLHVNLPRLVEQGIDGERAVVALGAHEPEIGEEREFFALRRTCIDREPARGQAIALVASQEPEIRSAEEGDELVFVGSFGFGEAVDGAGFLAVFDEGVDVDAVLVVEATVVLGDTDDGVALFGKEFGGEERLSLVGASNDRMTTIYVGFRVKSRLE